MWRRSPAIGSRLFLKTLPPEKKKREALPGNAPDQKGTQWHLGVKVYIDVDGDSGLSHTLGSITADLGDITQAQALLHRDGTTTFGDAGHQGVEKRQEKEHCVGVE